MTEESNSKQNQTEIESTITGKQKQKLTLCNKKHLIVNPLVVVVVAHQS